VELAPPLSATVERAVADSADEAGEDVLVDRAAFFDAEVALAELATAEVATAEERADCAAAMPVCEATPGTSTSKPDKSATTNDNVPN
jgi:hypothetical protein